MATDVVMLVEIPSLEVILVVIAAFLAGVSGVCLYYIISTHFKSKNRTSDNVYSDRFRYYEKQLIDMKIRLDSLGVLDAESRFQEPPQAHTPIGERAEQEPHVPETQNKSRPETQPTKSTTHEPTNKHLNSTDYVLHLITDNPMTSRDIQIMLKKSREHTSRLMKRLYMDGYVKRNMESKPYTYSITEKGVAKTKT